MPHSSGHQVSLQKGLTWEVAFLLSVAQDPVQGLCIRRKQGVSPWSLVTQTPVQVLQSQQQVETVLPRLSQAPLVESLAEKPGLFVDLLAWVTDFLFNYFPLQQEDPDLRVRPRAIGTFCYRKRDGDGSVDSMHMHIWTFPGARCCTPTEEPQGHHNFPRDY